MQAIAKITQLLRRQVVVMKRKGDLSGLADPRGQGRTLVDRQTPVTRLVATGLAARLATNNEVQKAVAPFLTPRFPSGPVLWTNPPVMAGALNPALT